MRFKKMRIIFPFPSMQARSQREGLGDLSPPFTQKFFNLLGFCLKKPEISPLPKTFPYKKFENPSLEEFLATLLRQGLQKP